MLRKIVCFIFLVILMPLQVLGMDNVGKSKDFVYEKLFCHIRKDADLPVFLIEKWLRVFVDDDIQYIFNDKKCVAGFSLLDHMISSKPKVMYQIFSCIYSANRRIHGELLNYSYNNEIIGEIINKKKRALKNPSMPQAKKQKLDIEIEEEETIEYIHEDSNNDENDESTILKAKLVCASCLSPNRACDRRSKDKSIWICSRCYSAEKAYGKLHNCGYFLRSSEVGKDCLRCNKKVKISEIKDLSN